MSLSLAFSGIFVCSFGLAASEASKDKKNTENQPKPQFAPVLRWGKADPDSESAELSTALTELFQNRGHALNFDKRGLTSLLEQALPRRIGNLFPFRKPHYVPQNFIFENFGRRAFLVGELNPRVPPILSGTETADWIELKGTDAVQPAREFTPPLLLSQGLRGLSLQNPWTAEIFSSTWTQQFDAAAALIEHGGLKCQRSAGIKKTDPNPPQIPNYFRCSVPLTTLARESGIPKQLPKRIGALASPGATGTASPAVAPSCLPMGRLNTQTLEMLGNEKNGHCLLWRSSLDERFQQRSLSSKLICLNSRHKSFQRTRFNSVVAVLPASRPDAVHIIESEDGLISAHRMSLATLSATREEIGTQSGQNQNIRNASFPRNRTGLYACQQPTGPNSQLFPPTEILGANVDWIYIDDSLYSGLRPLRPETDVAWRIKESSDSTLDIERLSWSQLQYDHPSITNDRPFACVAGREIDSKCAIRVLQTALQVSEEWLAGDYDRANLSPQVQLSLTLLLAQSLEKVSLALPDWALREETETLLNLFAKKARSIVDSRVLGAAGPRLDYVVKTPPQAHRYLDISFESQDYLSFKKSLSTANDFWAQIKQKSL